MASEHRPPRSVSSSVGETVVVSPSSSSSSSSLSASSSSPAVASKQGPNDAAIPPYMKAISGSLGGMVEAGCLQPIDVIKTRLQLDHQKHYKGIWNCGTTIVQKEGVRALWKGLTPFATHLTLKYTLRMGSNAVLQTALTDPETGKISAAGRMVAGFGAGVLEALVIVTPFEVGIPVLL
jgi:solute carrier family 25 citrate transporter 1